MSEQFELYSMKLYNGMTKSKSLASSIVVPSIFAIHLEKGAQILNHTEVGLLCAGVMISPLTKM